VTCEQCGHEEPASCERRVDAACLINSRCDAAYENIEITTHSRPDAFPSALRQKLRKTQTKIHGGDEGLLRVRVTISFRGMGRSSVYSGGGEVPELRAHGSVLEGDAGERRVLHARAGRRPRGQLRGADEGSTILYTVRNLPPARTGLQSLMRALAVVRGVQVWVEGEQLREEARHVYPTNIKHTPRHCRTARPRRVRRACWPRLRHRVRARGCRSWEDCERNVCERTDEMKSFDARRKVEREAKCRSEEDEGDVRQRRGGDQGSERCRAGVDGLRARDPMSSTSRRTARAHEP
jgi:hypothetical protein